MIDQRSIWKIRIASIEVVFKTGRKIKQLKDLIVIKK